MNLNLNLNALYNTVEVGPLPRVERTLRDLCCTMTELKQLLLPERQPFGSKRIGFRRGDINAAHLRGPS